MDDTRNETDSATNDEKRDDTARAGRGAERQPEGEHRTTVKAESERLRAAEATQAEHPDLIGGRGRATGEPPLDDASERDGRTG